MRIIKQAAIAIAAAGLILGPMVAHAEGMGHQDGGQHFGACNMQHHHEHGLERVVKFLNLTGEQQDKVFLIVHEQEPQLYKNHKIIRESRKELRSLTTAATYDNAQVLVLSNQIGSAIASNIAIRSQMNRQIYDLLTSDQKHKLAEIKKKFEERHERFSQGK